VVLYTFKWYLIPQKKLPGIAWRSTGKKTSTTRSQVLRCPPPDGLCLPPAGGSQILDLTSAAQRLLRSHLDPICDISGTPLPAPIEAGSMAAMMVAMLPAASMADLIDKIASRLAGAVRNNRSTHSNGYEGQPSNRFEPYERHGARWRKDASRSTCFRGALLAHMRPSLRRRHTKKSSTS
jgi:hypothetical protein